MTDPFDALHLPVRPVDPDPAFAARLRARLADAVLAPDRGDMTSTETKLSTLTPYLAVTDARAAIEFYTEVFGAVRQGEPIVVDDGRVGHAELVFGGSVVMLSEEFPEVGHLAPVGTHPSYRIEVADLDGVVRRAVERGAELLRPVADSPHGRGGTVLDPFGHRWLVAEAAPQPQSGPAPRHGELGYHTFQVPDAEAAKSFYGAVLGWRFTPGRVQEGWRIDGAGTMAGLWGGQEQVGWKLMYAVRDLDAALAEVVGRGGTAGPVEREDYGLTAECTDDQGIGFWLWQA
ncbi:VOC family protein [Umezawaea tangerina]|uniref:Putative glyoxalase superfamily protein PhnB n=1 Tax=Umezawaea tangerina TaxID=84725 RepID=A0A2T0TLG3_9PSEU|nr:VOC family protein [Umezawaea tangerina]PRY46513.1 putative glyoxalase superfamily protein PhnB [Umezawaea tangerina]